MEIPLFRGSGRKTALRYSRWNAFISRNYQPEGGEPGIKVRVRRRIPVVQTAVTFPVAMRLELNSVN